MFFGKSFKPELCSLVLAPRGSRIRLCFENCRLRRNAQIAFLQAIRERENTDDHHLCLRLDQTYFERHIFIQILDSNKVDTLKLDYWLGRLLHNECIQALTQSQLHCFDGNATLPCFSPLEQYTPFLNNLQFEDHLKALVLHNVMPTDKPTNCLITILHRHPNLTSFGIISAKLSPQHWLEFLDAVRMHPSHVS